MEVTYQKHFTKEYEKLDPRLKAEVEERLVLFKIDPLHEALHNHELHGKYEDHRSININWNLRAIYLPVSENKAHFVRLGTHSDLYDE